MQHLCCNSDLNKQIQPPKRPVQQQWGSCWQNRCGLCETRQLNPDWGFHHYVFSLLIVALRAKRQKCWELLWTQLHRQRKEACRRGQAHPLSNRTAVLDGWCPPLCHWAIFGLPERICWRQLLWWFSTRRKINKFIFSFYFSTNTKPHQKCIILEHSISSCLSLNSPLLGRNSYDSIRFLNLIDGLKNTWSWCRVTLNDELIGRINSSFLFPPEIQTQWIKVRL